MIKNLIIILLALIFSIDIAYSYEQFNNSEINIYGYQFEKNAIEKFLNSAKNYMVLWEKTEDPDLKQKYLKEAMRYYFLAEKADKTNIETHIGLGKIYDELKLDKYAMQHFSIAYNINNKNPDLNYKFGDFYFKRKDLYKAQIYFNNAYNNGFANNPKLSKKMTQLYERLADTAKKKAIQAQAAVKNTIEFDKANKIRILDELNPGGSQYNLYIK